jgi:hypothetical protein
LTIKFTRCTADRSAPRRINLWRQPAHRVDQVSGVRSQVSGKSQELRLTNETRHTPAGIRHS